MIYDDDDDDDEVWRYDIIDLPQPLLTIINLLLRVCTRIWISGSPLVQTHTRSLHSQGQNSSCLDPKHKKDSSELGSGPSTGNYTGWPVKHGRVFLVPCKGIWPVYAWTVAYTGHFLQGTRKTRPCLTGHPVIVDSSISQAFTKSKPSMQHRSTSQLRDA